MIKGDGSRTHQVQLTAKDNLTLPMTTLKRRQD